MEKWTFDTVFSGPMEKQAWKVAHVRNGVRAAYASAEERYAQALIDNEWGEAETALKDVTEIREFCAAFDARPELVEVRAYTEKLQKRETKDALQKFLFKELGLDDDIKS